MSSFSVPVMDNLIKENFTFQSETKGDKWRLQIRSRKIGHILAAKEMGCRSLIFTCL